MRSWRSSQGVAILSVASFLLIQLAIPIARIGDHERAQRFGWQMFAVVSEATEFVVLTRDGEESVDLGMYLARVRGDLDLEKLLPPFLCHAVDGARSVKWSDESFECPTG